MHYTITVTDTGQTPYTGATVTDDLTGCSTTPPTTATPPPPPAPSATPAPVLTWTGNLTPGQARHHHLLGHRHNPDTGDKILTNTVTSAAAGSNCPARHHRPPLHQPPSRWPR